MMAEGARDGRFLCHPAWQTSWEGTPLTPDMNAEAFAALAEELHEGETVGETAAQVVEFACEQLDADHAGITMLHRRGRLETVAPTDPVVREIDRLQHELREGCCVDSAWQGETLKCESLATDPRWPTWGPRAAALGVASALSVELTTNEGNRRVGALNLYWAEGRTFTRDDVAFAHIFGRHAALALSSSMTRHNLHVALDSRKRIGMAQGILMERFGLGPDQAFQLLRRYSQDHNEKLRDVADNLITRGELPAYPVRPTTTSAPTTVKDPAPPG